MSDGLVDRSGLDLTLMAVQENKSCVFPYLRIQFLNIKFLKSLKMNTGVILLLVIGAAVGAYFIFFNESKQEYSEVKIKKIFDEILDLITPHEDDHKHMIRRKRAIADQMIKSNKFYQRKPSIYDKEEIEFLENLIPETNKDMSEFCETLLTYKPNLVELIQAHKEMIESSKNVLKTRQEVGEQSDDAEDFLDIVESNLESSPEELRELEEELRKLEITIAKYKK